MCMYCKQGPHSNFAGQTSGSTACVTIIRNNYTFVANAGYSRCVICGKSPGGMHKLEGGQLVC